MVERPGVTDLDLGPATADHHAERIERSRAYCRLPGRVCRPLPDLIAEPSPGVRQAAKEREILPARQGPAAHGIPNTPLSVQFGISDTGRFQDLTSAMRSIRLAGHLLDDSAQ